jgi:tetratricopeptide (TPR) repeat protein
MTMSRRFSLAALLAGILVCGYFGGTASAAPAAASDSVKPAETTKAPDTAADKLQQARDLVEKAKAKIKAARRPASVIEKIKEAIADLNKAAGLAPDLIDVYIQRSKAYDELAWRLFQVDDRRQEELLAASASDAEKALDLNPKSAEAHAQMASVCESKEDIDRGIEEATKAITLKPDCEDAYFMRGILQNQKCMRGIKGSDRSQAMKDLDKAIELDPRDFRPYCARGEILFLLGKTDEGAEDFAKSLELDPEQTGAHNNLGWAIYVRAQTALAQGRQDEGQRLLKESEDHYKESLRIDPKNAAAHNNYALLLISTNRRDEGIKHLKEALRLSPDYPAAHSNLAHNYMIMREFTEAVEQFGEYLKRSPNDMSARANHAYCLGELGKTDEALAEVEGVIKAQPKYALGHANKGMILIKAGRVKAAIEEFVTAARLEPATIQFRMYLAKALAQDGQLEAAVSEYNGVLREKPDNPEALTGLAETLEKMGQVEKAKEIRARLEALKKPPAKETK